MTELCRAELSERRECEYWKQAMQVPTMCARRCVHSIGKPPVQSHAAIRSRHLRHCRHCRIQSPHDVQGSKAPGSQRYALAFTLATLVAWPLVWFGNKSYGPEMYGSEGMVPAAAAHAQNQNYAVFDLNLNIRALRDEQLKRMTKTPDVIFWAQAIGRRPTRT